MLRHIQNCLPFMCKTLAEFIADSKLVDPTDANCRMDGFGGKKCMYHTMYAEAINGNKFMISDIKLKFTIMALISAPLDVSELENDSDSD